MNRFGWHWNTAPFGIQPLFDCLNIELVRYRDPHCILFLLAPATKRNTKRYTNRNMKRYTNRNMKRYTNRNLTSNFGRFVVPHLIVFSETGLSPSAETM